MNILKQVAAVAVAIGVSAAFVSGNALAHVVVKPAEVISASRQVFTVSVPNEKDIPTTAVKVLIPEGVESVTPTAKAGWTIATEKEGTGESATVTEITWNGGTIGPDLRDDFTFSAKAPAQTSELKWKAYQTYADGTIVAWDKDTADNSEEVPNSGPLSVTKVVNESEEEIAAKTEAQATANAQSTANRSFYTAVIAVLAALTAIYFATRKKA